MGISRGRLGTAVFSPGREARRVLLDRSCALPALLLPGSLLVLVGLAGFAGAACSSAQPASLSGDDDGNGTDARRRPHRRGHADGHEQHVPRQGRPRLREGRLQHVHERRRLLPGDDRAASRTTLTARACRTAWRRAAAAARARAAARAAATAARATTTSVAKGIFVNEVYPAVSGTCAGCHGQTGPGPQFFGTTADLTLPDVQDRRLRQGEQRLRH